MLSLGIAERLRALRGASTSTRKARYHRTFLERLETRDMLTVIPVTPDMPDGSAGSLRDAIEIANASPGDDTILMAAGTYNLTIQSSQSPANDNSFGDLDVTDTTGTLTILGAGAAATTIDAGNNSRVLELHGNAKLDVTGVTFTHGKATNGGPGIPVESADGGGIESQGDLTLRDCVVADNQADGGGDAGGGGGIASFQANLTLIRSAVTNNSVGVPFAEIPENGGGGIANIGGTVELQDSDVAANHAAGIGGGLYNLGTAIIRNSVIRGNVASLDGGGIWHRGLFSASCSTLSGNTTLESGGAIFITDPDTTSFFVNDTVANNQTLSSTSQSGGIHVASGGLTLVNTLVAGNNALVNPTSDVFGAVDPQSHHNIVQSTIGFTGLSDPSNLIGVDPLLGPLADNGGPTLTHALLPASPAIDAGSDNGADGLVTDQRGLRRIVDGNGDINPTVDIGAFEIQQPIVLSITKADPDPTSADTVHYTVTFSEAVSGVDAGDFKLVPSAGLSGTSITGASGGGTTYTVTVSTGSGFGTLALNLVDDDSISDSFEQALGGPGPINGDFTGPVYTINRPPQALSITKDDLDPTSADTVHFTVTFSEAVTGVDATDFALVHSAPVLTNQIQVIPVSPTVYSVVVFGVRGNGTLGLNLVDDNSITTGGEFGLYLNQTVVDGGPPEPPIAGEGNLNGPAYTIVHVPSVFVVNVPDDIVDTLPGDGLVDVDPNTPGDQISLRAAIQECNALPGDQTIIVPAGLYKLTATHVDGNTDDAEGDLDVTKPLGKLTITGAGAQDTIIDAQGIIVRVLEIYSGARLTLNDVTLRGGDQTNIDGLGGGGIKNAGELVASGIAVTGNQALAGGGIWNSGSLTLSDSEVSDNWTPGAGGGIWTSGSLSVANSTVSGNQAAGDGGGVFVAAGTSGITNGTVANNESGNFLTAGKGGGIFGAVTLLNSIVSENFGGFPDVPSPNDVNNNDISIESRNNLIGGDVRLAPLDNYGGPTRTHALLPGSPAINAGDNSVASQLGGFDQRGFTRVVDGTIDIGAVESVPAVAFTQITDPVNLSNHLAIAASGRGEAGAGISLVVSDLGSAHSTSPATTTVAADGAWSINNINVSALSDGMITYTATSADEADNTTVVTKSAIKDTVAPAILSITKTDSDPTSADTVHYTVTFSQSVSDVDTADFILIPSAGLLGTSITDASGSGATYTVTVSTGSGDGTLGLNLVDNDSISDGAGNPLGGPGQINGDFPGPVYTINRPPQVLSITKADPDPTSAATVRYMVTFTEAVTGVDAGDFKLVPSAGLSGTSITGASGGGTTYTVTVSTGSGFGTLGLNLVDNDSISDSFEQALGGPGPINGDFTGPVYTIPPGLTLKKLVQGFDANQLEGPQIRVGAMANFTYQVSGKGVFSTVTLLDDNGTPDNASDDFAPAPVLTAGATGPQFNVGDTNQDGQLDPGEIWRYAAAESVATAGQHFSQAKTTGVYILPGGPPSTGLSSATFSTSATDGAYYYGVQTGVNIKKFVNGQDANTSPGPVLHVGDQATFTYQVTNIGAKVTGHVTDTIFFQNTDSTHGGELWKTEGTLATTSMVKDINPGVGSSTPMTLTTVGNTLFFAADDGVHGTELWKSDGTEEGTVLVKDIGPGVGSSTPMTLTTVGNTLFFVADDGVHGRELWKSDGTEVGTVLVKDITLSTGFSISSLTNVDGRLLFVADDGTHGYELWKSDGTEAGTVLVKDIYPGAGNSFPSGFTEVNGTLFFTADDGTHGDELWKSDGTEVGTVLVKDIIPGNVGSNPFRFTEVNGTLFFTVDDGTHGYELWKSDGTEAGTVLVKDISPGTGNSFPSGFTEVNGTLFFTADDGTHGDELWKSDGTEAGTVLVKDISPGTGNSFPSGFTEVNGALFFGADDGTHGDELWKSDGTTSGTVLVSDINPGSASARPFELVMLGGELFFAVTDGSNPYALWRSDGTEGGTLLVAPIDPQYGYESILLNLTPGKSIFSSALSGIAVVDDNGTPGNSSDDFTPSLLDGDTSRNGLLDVDETWTYSATRPVSRGPYTNVATVTALDSLGNPLTGSDLANYVGVDTKVLSITKADPDPTSAATVHFTVTFSNPVTGVDTADFILIPSAGLLATSITGVSGSGTTYTVTVSTGSGDGTLGLNLVDNDSIRDSALNPLGGPGRINGDFPGKVYMIDKTAAIQIAKTVPANGSITVGDTITLTYTVTNRGKVPLTVTEITDDNGTADDVTDDPKPVMTKGDTNHNGLLDVGESWIYEATITVKVDGQFQSISNVTAKDPFGQIVTGMVVTKYAVQRPDPGGGGGGGGGGGSGSSQAQIILLPKLESSLALIFPVGSTTSGGSGLVVDAAPPSLDDADYSGAVEIPEKQVRQVLSSLTETTLPGSEVVDLADESSRTARKPLGALPKEDLVTLEDPISLPEGRSWLEYSAVMAVTALILSVGTLWATRRRVPNTSSRWSAMLGRWFRPTVITPNPPNIQMLEGQGDG